MIRKAEERDASSLAAVSIEVWVNTYLRDGVSPEFAGLIRDGMGTGKPLPTSSPGSSSTARSRFRNASIRYPCPRHRIVMPRLSAHALAETFDTDQT